MNVPWTLLEVTGKSHRLQLGLLGWRAHVLCYFVHNVMHICAINSKNVCPRSHLPVLAGFLRAQRVIEIVFGLSINFVAGCGDLAICALHARCLNNKFGVPRVCLMAETFFTPAQASVEDPYAFVVAGLVSQFCPSLQCHILSLGCLLHTCIAHCRRET